ncbi:hypothetical protein JG688_00005974, partial [Phytophthora aleatoria]
QVPLLKCHSYADSRARYEWALKSKQRLAGAGVKDITFHTYPNMDYTSSPQELKDIRAWLSCNCIYIRLALGSQLDFKLR